MPSNNTSHEYVGVIGAGSFGTVVANLLAHHAHVLLYDTVEATITALQQTRRTSEGYPLALNISPVHDLSEVLARCKVLFPVVPAREFRAMMRQMSPWVQPHHILIHGTKGLDVQWPPQEAIGIFPSLTRDRVKTMSEVIQEESNVHQVGCFSGPNLAGELASGKPAATVVASTREEVVTQGQRLLQNDNFQVYRSPDLLGVELCGALKNIVAIGAGCLDGLAYGENARSLLISRGVLEMAQIGQAMGASLRPFIGLAGIGDLVATCTNSMSRNYTLGYRLAQGAEPAQLVNHKHMTVEGVNTVKIVQSLVNYDETRAPITQLVYSILFEDVAVQEAMQSFTQSFTSAVDVAIDLW